MTKNSPNNEVRAICVDLVNGFDLFVFDTKGYTE
jgi:hypothetical protein